MPTGLYEVAAWLLAPAPGDFSIPAQHEEESDDSEDSATS
jgi:hypothetical protein